MKQIQIAVIGSNQITASQQKLNTAETIKTIVYKILTKQNNNIYFRLNSLFGELNSYISKSVLDFVTYLKVVILSLNSQCLSC